MTHRVWSLIIRKARRVLLLHQNGLCASCGQPIPRGLDTLDHVIPRRRGGFDGFGNAVVMHWQCNHLKGDRMPTGCELIWLLAVNARLGVGPQRWAA